MHRICVGQGSPLARAAIPKLRVAMDRPTAQQGSGKFSAQLAMHLKAACDGAVAGVVGQPGEQAQGKAADTCTPDTPASSPFSCCVCCKLQAGTAQVLVRQESVLSSLQPIDSS